MNRSDDVLPLFAAKVKGGLSWLPSIIVGAVFGLIGVIVSSEFTLTRSTQTLESNTGGLMLDCVKNALKIVSSEKPNIDTLYDASELCYYQFYTEGLIGDFQIRRSKFKQQNHENQ